MLKKEQQKAMEQETSPHQETPNTPFTLEQLFRVWDALSHTYKTLPRLHATLSTGKPRIENNTHIFFEVESQAQREWIEQKCLGTMVAFLQKELQNSAITLSLEAKPTIENDKNRLYMPEEKAKFLLETHPQVAALKNDLHLDLT